MCVRCEELEAELANLKHVLGVTKGSAEVAAVRREFGVVITEAKLMLALYRAPGAMHKNQIHTIIYGDRIDGGPEPKIIDVMICKIRKNIGAWNIETQWGVGYNMTAECRDRMAKALEPLARAA